MSNAMFIAGPSTRINNLFMTTSIDRLHQRLKEMDKTPAWLAKELGISEQRLNNWKRRGAVSKDMLGPAARKLLVTVDWLHTGNYAEAPEELRVAETFSASRKEQDLVLRLRKLTEGEREMVDAMLLAAFHLSDRRAGRTGDLDVVKARTRKARKASDSAPTRRIG